MKTNIRSLILVICCWLLPGALALRPRRPFALGEKAAQPHHLPAKSFDVSKCKASGVDRVEADKHSGLAGNSISSRNKVLDIRGGASAVGVVTSPAFWLGKFQSSLPVLTMATIYLMSICLHANSPAYIDKSTDLPLPTISSFSPSNFSGSNVRPSCNG